MTPLGHDKISILKSGENCYFTEKYIDTSSTDRSNACNHGHSSRAEGVKFLKFVANFLLIVGLASSLKSYSAVSSFSACIDERPWIPYTYPKVETPGSMQIMIVNASRAVNLSVDVRALPWKRCLESVKAGKIDAIIGASDVPLIRQFAEFPKVPGTEFPDETRSLGTARIMLVKRVGSDIEWNGRSLSHLKKPVGVAMGTLIMQSTVQKLGGNPDDGAVTDDQNMKKLLQHRVDLMAGYENDLEVLIRKGYAGQVAILPTPLIESHYFLAFSKHFYSNNRILTESIWSRLAELRNSAILKSHSHRIISSTLIQPGL